MSQITLTPLAEIDDCDRCQCGEIGAVECSKPILNGDTAVWVVCHDCLEPSVEKAQEEPTPTHELGDVLMVNGEPQGKVTEVIPMNTRHRGQTFVYEVDGWFTYWQHEVDA